MMVESRSENVAISTVEITSQRDRKEQNEYLRNYCCVVFDSGSDVNNETIK